MGKPNSETKTKKSQRSSRQLVDKSRSVGQESESEADEVPTSTHQRFGSSSDEEREHNEDCDHNEDKGCGDDDLNEGDEESDQDDFELEDKDEDEIRNDLSAMSFEELQALKERIGLKMYKEAVFGEQRKRSKVNFKRENKNRPREESAKRPVSVIREVFQTKKKAHNDPRFDPRAGEYSEKVFKSTYSFISDLRSKERAELEEMLRSESDPEQRKTIKKLLQRMKNREATEKQKRRQSKIDEEYRKFVAESKEHGVTPKFLSKKERRQVELAERFRELKKVGKLDKYLEKRRKKNVRKERKHLPGIG